MKLLPSRLFGRLVLGLALVSLLAVGVSAVYIYSRFHNTRSMFYEGTVQSYAGLIIKDVRFVDGSTIVAVQKDIADRIAQSGGQYIVTDGRGRRLAGSPEATQSFIWFNDDNVHYFWLPKPRPSPDLFGVSARIPGAPDGAVVQIVVPEGHVLFESVLHEFMRNIAWLWIPFLLMILVTNVSVVRLALRPLAAVVEEASAIQPGGVEIILSEKSLPDDVLALVRTINEALARLRYGYRLQEEFVADMAHELRTPIAIMKAQMASGEGYEVHELLRDLDMMDRLVEQLLDRARLGKFRLEPGDVVDLGNLARDVASFLAPRIIERGRTIQVLAGEQPVLVPGGHDDMFRALRNLIENALEYSPRRGVISVEVTDAPAVMVKDEGSGYPSSILDSEHRRNLNLRSDRRDGAGLGLSIVDRTMHAHGGKLHLSNLPTGGACAAMIFRAREHVAS